LNNSLTEKKFAVQVALMKIWLARKQSKEVLQLLETIDASTLSSAEQQQLEKLRAMATKAKAT
jgi:hypothetical protein